MEGAHVEEEWVHNVSQVQLKGHRSVGGMRASVYNSMPLAGAQTLAEFMQVRTVMALKRLLLALCTGDQQ